jgi:hypothetical protein
LCIVPTAPPPPRRPQPRRKTTTNAARSRATTSYITATRASLQPAARLTFNLLPSCPPLPQTSLHSNARRSPVISAVIRRRPTSARPRPRTSPPDSTPPTKIYCPLTPSHCRTTKPNQRLHGASATASQHCGPPDVTCPEQTPSLLSTSLARRIKDPASLPSKLGVHAERGAPQRHRAHDSPGSDAALLRPRSASPAPNASEVFRQRAPHYHQADSAWTCHPRHRLPAAAGSSAGAELSLP